MRAQTTFASNHNVCASRNYSQLVRAQITMTFKA